MKNAIKRPLYIFLGCVAVAVGAVGVVTPVLPTTPLLLLATFLFARSSPRLNRALLHNRVFGKFLTNYFERKPIPMREKMVSIGFLWVGLGATFYFASLRTWVVVLLLVIGVAVTVHIATLGRWRRKN
jgi:uncharacterized membrane protein YbaN (DUF454 family)